MINNNNKICKVKNNLVVAAHELCNPRPEDVGEVRVEPGTH
jgi:hypothetical protein